MIQVNAMQFRPQDGRPWTLTPDLIDHIISNVPHVYFPNAVAILSGVPKSNLFRWLKQGEIEHNEGKYTLCAQLWEKFHMARHKDSKRFVGKLEECPKNYGALTFILERCFKEEFEQKSDTQKQLEDIVFNQLAPMLNKDQPNGKQSDEEEAAS